MADSQDPSNHEIQTVRHDQLSCQRNVYWRMPIEFGPLPGPRQDHDGHPFNSQHSTFRSAIIRFKTSQSLLGKFLPPRKGFRFRTPGEVGYASLMQHTFSKLDWLGGGGKFFWNINASKANYFLGYHLLGMYIHDVEYEKSDGEVLYGTYVPVLFGSLADPILSGREELGMPKLYASIDVNRRENSHRVNAGWQGANCGNFAWSGLEEVDPSSQAPSAGDPEDGLFCYRYIPRVGSQDIGSADADYPVLIPAKDEHCKPKICKMWKAVDATIHLDDMDWDALPTLHHIIHRLKELSIHEVVDAKIVEGEGVSSALATHQIW